MEELLGRGERIVIPEVPLSWQYKYHRGPTQDGLHIQVVIDGPTRYPEAAVFKGNSADDAIRAYAEILSRPRTAGDLELDQDNFQPYQDGIKTETKATGGNETDSRTGGDFKGGQDDSQL